MTTLQGIRDKVRLQGDLDEEDLPDDVLDGFIREAFDQTMALEQRWPFLEYTWYVTKADSASTIDMPDSPEVSFIQRLRDAAGRNLTHVGQQTAEANFEQSASGTPEFFSVWGSVITLWPTPADSAEQEFMMRGYRKPRWSDDPLLELDGDARLHLPIFHYAVALAYAQQEDPEMSAMYSQRWASTVDAIRRDMLRPQFQEPLILNAGSSRQRRKKVLWNWDEM